MIYVVLDNNKFYDDDVQICSENQVWLATLLPPNNSQYLIIQ